MATLFPTTPATQQSAKPQTGIWWKGTLIATCLAVTFGLWECGSELYVGYRASPTAVHRFHQELNQGQYEQICRDADPSFTEGENHDKFVMILQLVHAKLGNATEERLTNVNASVNTSGNSITTEFDTTFMQGTARETFIWNKKGNGLQLRIYNLTSDALLK
jgi:hypothetical protein